MSSSFSHSQLIHLSILLELRTAGGMGCDVMMLTTSCCRWTSDYSIFLFANTQTKQWSKSPVSINSMAFLRLSSCQVFPPKETHILTRCHSCKQNKLRMMIISEVTKMMVMRWWSWKKPPWWQHDKYEVFYFSESKFYNIWILWLSLNTMTLRRSARQWQRTGLVSWVTPAK